MQGVCQVCHAQAKAGRRENMPPANWRVVRRTGRWPFRKTDRELFACDQHLGFAARAATDNGTAEVTRLFADDTKETQQ